MKITYLPHSTTTDNEQGIATGWLPGELSAKGLEQAAQLFDQLAIKDFTAIVSSDSHRAVQTAQIAFGERYQLRQDMRLREANYGDLNGALHNFKDRMHEYIVQKFPNGESYEDVEVRVRSLLDELILEFGDGQIAFVSHQAPQLALDVICIGKSWQDAIASDWRFTKSWQPGWVYNIMADLF